MYVFTPSLRGISCGRGWCWVRATLCVCMLITQWVGAAMEILHGREEYPFRLFEKCGMAMSLGGLGDDRINLEGLDKPYYTFMDAEDPSDDEKGL
ncbi:unnamed protein product [Ectocarpus fasciculatus]